MSIDRLARFLPRLPDAMPRPNAPCPACDSTRILAHPELGTLAIAHLDCDAFYAAIEKRDDPSLHDKPLIIGGGTRGVVSTACYIARKSGVRSAMPMFQARKLCPQAIIVKPRIAYYAEAARTIRGLMRALTPLVEPLSLDEAYLDLSGTDRIHGMVPARTTMAEAGAGHRAKRGDHRVHRPVGQQIPRQAGVGTGQAARFCRDRHGRSQILPARQAGGDHRRSVGKVLQARLECDGITRIGQLQDMDPRELADRYGSTGLWLSRVAQAVDSRAVDPGGDMKTISSETTFNSDLTRLSDLEAVLWRQAERVSARMGAMAFPGRTVVLKLKTNNFQASHPQRLAGTRPPSWPTAFSAPPRPP